MKPTPYLAKPMTNIAIAEIDAIMSKAIATEGKPFKKLVKTYNLSFPPHIL
jgi:hypothetical protein